MLCNALPSQQQKIGANQIGRDGVPPKVGYDDLFGPFQAGLCWGLCIGAGGEFGFANHSWALGQCVELVWIYEMCRSSLASISLPVSSRVSTPVLKPILSPIV